MSEGGPKKEKDAHVQITVVNQNGADVVFKIKPTTQLKKMFDVYCQRQGVRGDTVRFLFNGQRLQPTQTPLDLEMHEGDVIDAVLQQTGGSQ